jgi:DNA-binding MarR family transcriptional regulator
VRVTGTHTRPAAEPPRWLDDEQQSSWRAFAAATGKLRWALECQLQRDAGLSFVEYHALARLSENPDHTMRMSELAEVTIASLSRLSHLVKRLERRDLVRREPDPDDGRYTNALLTPAGWRLLTASAPAHVAKVRELVIDALTPAELRHLRTASERILERIEASDRKPATDGQTDRRPTSRPLGEDAVVSDDSKRVRAARAARGRGPGLEQEPRKT